MQIDRATPERIKKFVRKVIAGDIFLSTQIRESDMNLLPSIFLPLALGALDFSECYPPKPEEPEPAPTQLVEDVEWGYEPEEMLYPYDLAERNWLDAVDRWKKECDQIYREQVSLIGVMYAHMKEACPRSINGYPSFMEVRFLHKDDWEVAKKLIVKTQAAMDLALEDI